MEEMKVAMFCTVLADEVTSHNIEHLALCARFVDGHKDIHSTVHHSKQCEREEQVPVLLSVIGGKTYELLSDLLSPNKPFSELQEVLLAHFKPKLLERFHFHRQNQAPSESITEYVAELRHLATHYKFGAYLSEALRDRLVCSKGACTQI